MIDTEKVREVARRHQGTMTDSQYLQMIYALEDIVAWKEQQMIEKAVKWIKSQMIPYGTSPLAIFNYIEEFKKAMEE